VPPLGGAIGGVGVLWPEFRTGAAEAPELTGVAVHATEDGAGW